MGKTPRANRATKTTATPTSSATTPTPAPHKSSAQKALSKTNDCKVQSLRELNARLLVRVHAAESAVDHLRQLQSADYAVVKPLQHKIAQLEECARDKELELCAIRAVRAQRQQEVSELRAAAEEREAAVEELTQKVRTYEVELAKTKGVILQMEGEAKTLKKVAREIQNENNQLVDKVGELTRVGEGLRKRVNKLEQDWREKGVSSSTLASSSSDGMGVTRREAAIADGEKWWWEKVWELVQRAWGWLIRHRGEEGEPLLGRTVCGLV